MQVRISKGLYRGQQIEGTFELIQPYKEGARGGYVTIRNPEPKPGCPDVQRVSLTTADFVVLDATGEEVGAHVVLDTGNGGITSATQYEALYTQDESEEDAMNRIRETFAMLERITDDVAAGDIRGIVVSGPPGVGKSFGVEAKLVEANMFRTMNGEDPLFEIVSGSASPLGLYRTLHENRAEGQVLVFDDMDTILFDEDCLNLLKAALNSGERRRVCWHKESRILQNEDIPTAFDFEGGVIFLSNVDFEASIARGSRISDHLSAIMSRCHYLDLEISSTRDKILRIKQVVYDGMLNDYEFNHEQIAAILKYVEDNAEFLRELSLRMVKKIADFVRSEPNDWEKYVEATCLKREAKFKRLYERKLAEKKAAEEAA